MRAIMPVKEENGWDSELNPRFGRTGFFAVVDLDQDKIEFIENKASNAASGAGVQAAQFVADQDVDIMFTPNVGPKAFSGLNRLNLKIFLANGKVKEIIRSYKNGELKEANEPTNEAQHQI